MTRLLPLLPSREERAGERRAVRPTRKPLSPTLSPFVPHGEREKIGVAPQQCFIQWRCHLLLLGRELTAAQVAPAPLHRRGQVWPQPAGSLRWRTISAVTRRS